MRQKIISHGLEDTYNLAQELAQKLLPGSVLLLSGDLGAGKTTFVKGFAVGLGIDESKVTSPSFGLIHEYRDGRIPFAHADLYRLGPNISEDVLEEIGFYEYLNGKWIVAVEWADYYPDIIRHEGRNPNLMFFQIVISVKEDGTREFMISQVISDQKS